MEIYNPSSLRNKAFNAITQNGSGGDMDRYIYNQHGEGLASFFGSIMKNAVPFLGRAIKGGWKVAQPHIAAAGKELIVTGAKKGVETITQLGSKRKRTKATHKSHKQRAKWQSL